MGPVEIALANCILCPVIQIGFSELAFRIPSAWLDPDARIFRLSRRERRPGFFHLRFRLRTWRRWLPDGGRLLGRFSKARLERLDPSYVQRFLVETCRGEAAHWMMLGATPVFFTFNPPWAGLVMLAYALVANLPCILSQRRLRAGLLRVRDRQAGGAVGSKDRAVGRQEEQLGLP